MWMFLRISIQTVSCSRRVFTAAIQSEDRRSEAAPELDDDQGEEIERDYKSCGRAEVEKFD